MAAEKTTGIVLRVIAFSETSCIVTLFTREFGKITTMAKGARRPKSPFEAALDVLAICRIVFLDKSSGAMGLLTEAKLERRFRSATRNLNQLYAGYYVVELLNTLNDEGDPHPDLFDYAVATISQIDSNETHEDQLNEILLRFELKTLELLGHLPMLTKCVGCGREKTTLTRVSFGLNLGGIVCQSCRRGESNIISLSADGLQLLLGLVGGQIGSDHRNSDNWNQIESHATETFDGGPNEVRENKRNQRDWNEHVSEQTSSSQTDSMTKDVVDRADCQAEVKHLVHRYITHLVGFPPKLHKYLKNI
jgi:DNA repair protein RecO (recombination protein O)